MRSRLLVADGGHVAVGQQLIAGAMNPHEVLRILGGRAVQLHLVHEVQEVYRSQGVSIHDKHIEIIIRQMLKRVNVLESGDTELLPGELVERPRFEEVNRAVVDDGGTSASGRAVLMGITKASLATESGCRRPPSRRPPGCSPTRPSTPSRTRCSASRKMSSSASSSRPAPACPCTGTSGSSRPRMPGPRPSRRVPTPILDGYAFGQGSGEAVPLEEYDFGSYNR